MVKELILSKSELRKLHFPCDYGDSISIIEDESRISNHVVEALKDLAVQRVIVSVVISHGIPIVVTALDAPQSYVPSDIPGT